IQYNEEGADDMRRMVEQTRVKKAFLLYLLMFLPISPQEAQVFSEVDESVRSELNLAGVELQDD
ncbi:MAG: hypothetical protein EZS28_029533, partial [Streblomastix strix]